MDAPYVGDSVIRHELIHLFAAELGASPLKIAKNRLGLPNMALTEGLAEAYSPEISGLAFMNGPWRSSESVNGTT